MKNLLAAIIFLVPTQGALCQVASDLIGPDGLVSHNSLDAPALQAFEVLYERFDSSADNNCRDEVRAAKERISGKEMSAFEDADLSFDQQIELEGVRQSCIDTILSSTEDIRSALTESGGVARIMLVNLPIIVGQESIGSKGSVTIEVCGLPNIIWQDEDWIGFVYPSVNMGKFRFNTINVSTNDAIADCSQAPGARLWTH